MSANDFHLEAMQDIARDYAIENKMRNFEIVDIRIKPAEQIAGFGIVLSSADRCELLECFKGASSHSAEAPKQLNYGILEHHRRDTLQETNKERATK